MMPAAKRQSVLIGKRGEIMRMRRVHHETNQRTARRSWSEDAHSRQFREAFHGVAGKIDIVFEDCRSSDLFNVIDRGCEPDSARAVRLTCFKSVWRFLRRLFFQSDADDHFTAAVPRWH